MDCNCYVHLVAHQPDCPAHNPPLTEEERVILAHYRGDCHNSAACRACKSEFGSAAAVTTERLARREAEQQRDTAKRDVVSLRQSLRDSNLTSAHRLREKQEAERQRDIAYAARDRAMDEAVEARQRLESVITGLSYATPQPEDDVCPSCGYVEGHMPRCVNRWSNS